MKNLRDLKRNQQYELRGYGTVTYLGCPLDKITRLRHYSFQLSSGKLIYLLPDDVRELVTETHHNVA